MATIRPVIGWVAFPGTQKYFPLYESDNFSDTFEVPPNQKFLTTQSLEFESTNVTISNAGAEANISPKDNNTLKNFDGVDLIVNEKFLVRILNFWYSYKFELQNRYYDKNFIFIGDYYEYDNIYLASPNLASIPNKSYIAFVRDLDIIFDGNCRIELITNNGGRLGGINISSGNDFSINDLNIFETEEEAKLASGINPNPYNPGGTSGIGGGDGSFGQGEASVDITGGIPSGSTEANTGKTGLFGSYLISPSQLKTVLGDRLWGTGAANFIANAGLNILFGRPIDSVIDVVSYPFDMSILGNFSIPTYTGNMKLGMETLLANYSKCLSSPYATFDWGTIQLSQFWGNFLDYSPYTKIELYLPWGTGFVEIDPNQVTPGALSVITNFDLAKGTCLHIVKSTQVLDGISQPPIIVGTFEGQPGKHIPVTGADYSSRTIWALTAATIAASATSWSVYSGVGHMTGGTSPINAIRALPPPSIGAGGLPIPYNPNAIDFASTGGSLPSIGGKDVPLFDASIGFDSSVLASIPAMDMIPPRISRNSSLSSNTSSMGIQHPYLVITRPIQNVPENYGHHFGYPSNILTNLSTLTGYTEVGAIHYENIDALATELSELDRLLKGGVIFQWLS